MFKFSGNCCAWIDEFGSAAEFTLQHVRQERIMRAAEDELIGTCTLDWVQILFD